MIRIEQLKVPLKPDEFSEDRQQQLLREKAAKLLKTKEEHIRKLSVLRRSFDLREQNNILAVYTILVKLSDSVAGRTRESEAGYVLHLKNSNISIDCSVPVQIPAFKGKAPVPVIVGAGPCGLFAALTFCEAGIAPVILEQGKKAEDRKEDVEQFFRTGILNPFSNVQFGEGGAGAFSDGKLNTSVKNDRNFIRFVLETFVRFGAPSRILYDQKPHVGTDLLLTVLRQMRGFIEEKGGRFFFETQFSDFETREGALCGVFGKDLKTGETLRFNADTLILAPGHSARQTYELLNRRGLPMERKPFAMGLRIAHPQELINEALYGRQALSEKVRLLGAASYKLTASVGERSVYSFCMCPGGYIVNASSEEGGLAVNGMSYSRRDGLYANAALAVNVRTDDYEGTDPLAGVRFQQKLERRAFELGCGKIPVQTLGAYLEGTEDSIFPDTARNAFKGEVKAADLNLLLPSFINQALKDSIPVFAGRLRGIDSREAVFAGLESRTSSPVRILRNPVFMSEVKGIFPAGEGAGYAGGITSAAVDGIKTALSVLELQGK